MLLRNRANGHKYQRGTSYPQHHYFVSHFVQRSRGRAIARESTNTDLCKVMVQPQKEAKPNKSKRGAYHKLQAWLLVSRYHPTTLGLLCTGFTLVAGFSRRLFPGNFNMAQIIIRKCPFSHILRHEGVWDYATYYLRTNPTSYDDSM